MSYEEQVCKDCHWWKHPDPELLNTDDFVTPCSASVCCDAEDSACSQFVLEASK